jgi:hypothetical protein
VLASSALATVGGFLFVFVPAGPESIFPDVIDWDEVIHHERREGLYYGAINFIRKLASALATFIALQVLGWAGYQAPPVGAVQFSQSPQALTAIRLLASPAVIFLLLAAIAFTWLFPLSRDRQQRIRQRFQSAGKVIAGHQRHRALILGVADARIVRDLGGAPRRRRKPAGHTDGTPFYRHLSSAALTSLPHRSTPRSQTAQADKRIESAPRHNLKRRGGKNPA